MIEKVGQDSDEYRNWKEGSTTIDIDDKISQTSEEKTIDRGDKETTQVSEKGINLEEYSSRH